MSALSLSSVSHLHFSLSFSFLSLAFLLARLLRLGLEGEEGGEQTLEPAGSARRVGVLRLLAATLIAHLDPFPVAYEDLDRQRLGSHHRPAWEPPLVRGSRRRPRAKWRPNRRRHQMTSSTRSSASHSRIGLFIFVFFRCSGSASPLCSAVLRSLVLVLLSRAAGLPAGRLLGTLGALRTLRALGALDCAPFARIHHYFFSSLCRSRRSRRSRSSRSSRHSRNRSPSS